LKSGFVTSFLFFFSNFFRGKRKGDLSKIKGNNKIITSPKNSPHLFISYHDNRSNDVEEG
jgi:hypothetical protein